MSTKLPTRQTKLRGFTLIELLLYISILGTLLITISYFFALTAEARVKNQTVNEVNDQATGIMDYLTQTIRNATSITSPAAGASAASLTLAVPTGSLSPTVFNISGSAGGSTLLGRNVDGDATDQSDSDSMNATKFTATATGTTSTLFALVGASVSASPNNKGQMAIYSGTSATPTTLLASSASTVITANTWASFSISPVSITSGQVYWLVFNTHGLASTTNNIRYHAGTTNQSTYIAQTFGSWPASWSTGTFQSIEFSMYAMIDAAAVPGGDLQVTEGAASALPLTNSEAQISNLTFKNLTKAGTAGLVQVSFTLTHVNPSSRNAYDFQKTFTTSAEITW